MGSASFSFLSSSQNLMRLRYHLAIFFPYACVSPWNVPCDFFFIGFDLMHVSFGSDYCQLQSKPTDKHVQFTLQPDTLWEGKKEKEVLADFLNGSLSLSLSLSVVIDSQRGGSIYLWLYVINLQSMARECHVALQQAQAH